MAASSPVCQFRSLADIAIYTNELLAPPANLAVAKRLLGAYRDGREHGTVEAIPFPDDPDEPDYDPNANAVPTPEQGVAALVALRDAYCPGVEKIVKDEPPEALEDLPRVFSWIATIERVRKLGDYSLPWFVLQLHRFERTLSGLQAGRQPNKDERPPEPTRAYCLVPPNKIRWKGEVEVEQRLWHLLGLAIDAESVAFEDIQDACHRDKEVANKTISNEIHQLNTHLLDIHFPWGVKPKGSYLVRNPEGP
jgi:hypothetical protein